MFGAIDWTALGLFFDGIGAILVLGTGVNIVQGIFRRYHPSFKKLQGAIFNLQIGGISRRDPSFDKAKKILNLVTRREEIMEKEFYSQVIVVDDGENLIATIPSPEVLPEDWPNHSEWELKSNIMEYLNKSADVDLQKNESKPFRYFRSDTNVIREIEPSEPFEVTPDDPTGVEEALVHYVPEVPKEHENLIDELPIIRTERYDYDRIRSAYNEYIEKVILRTGGVFLSVGFTIQLLARDSIHTTIIRTTVWILDVFESLFRFLIAV